MSKKRIPSLLLLAVFVCFFGCSQAPMTEKEAVEQLVKQCEQTWEKFFKEFPQKEFDNEKDKVEYSIEGTKKLASWFNAIEASPLCPQEYREALEDYKKSIAKTVTEMENLIQLKHPADKNAEPANPLQLLAAAQSMMENAQTTDKAERKLKELLEKYVPGERSESKPQTEKSSSSSSSKTEAPDQAVLNAAAKKELMKHILPQIPYDFVDVTVNWIDENQDRCVGTYTMSVKLQENIYKSVTGDEALSVFGITDTLERKVEETARKTYDLPDAFKSSLADKYPKDQFNRHSFYQPVALAGKEDRVSGQITLRNAGSSWEENGITVRSQPNIRGNILASDLPMDAKKTDDPQTKAFCENIINKRQAYIELVDNTIQELENQRLAAIAKQRKEVLEAVKKGSHYAGSWQNTNDGYSGKIGFIFKGSEMKDTLFSGTFYNVNNPEEERIDFTGSLSLDNVIDYPIQYSIKAFDRSPDVRNIDNPTRFYFFFGRQTLHGKLTVKGDKLEGYLGFPRNQITLTKQN